jgi:Spy/CpxP family protein refolding chaperone
MRIGEKYMKTAILIGVIVVVVLAALGVAGYALAQTVTPPSPDNARGWGMMGRQGGMMGGWRSGNGSYGPMHEYMEDAMAEALGISHDELEELLDQGKTMWQIAQDNGFTQEQFSELMINARTEALKKMVADGVITQEQADWMSSRMQQGWGGRGGFGGCPGMGGYYGGGGRWVNPPAQATPNSPAY